MRRLASLATVLVLAAGAVNAGPYRAPRTTAGAPDLQGYWTNTSITTLQRPQAFKTLVLTDAEAAQAEAAFAQLLASAGLGSAPVDPSAPAPPAVDDAPQSDNLEMDMHLARINGQLRSSWIVEPADGRLPFTDAARQARAAAAKAPESFDDPERRDTAERCLTAIGSTEGPPMMNGAFNGNYQIVQTPDHVAILVEMNHDVRIVRLKDRDHPPAAIAPWLGDSVGWYEGDTLIVETTNLNPKGAHVFALGGGFSYSPAARIVERFTRTSRDQILYAFSVEDPATFTQVWHAEMPMRSTKGPIYEYACHEGNYSLPNILVGARAGEKGR